MSVVLWGYTEHSSRCGRASPQARAPKAPLRGTAQRCGCASRACMRRPSPNPPAARHAGVEGIDPHHEAALRLPLLPEAGHRPIRPLIKRLPTVSPGRRRKPALRHDRFAWCERQKRERALRPGQDDRQVRLNRRDVGRNDHCAGRRVPLGSSRLGRERVHRQRRRHGVRPLHCRLTTQLVFT